jgi:uncharacterized membrane protein YdjX (TVP38/TMEM64 family)
VAALVLLGAVLVAARPVHDWLLEQLGAAETLIRAQHAAGMAVFVLLAAVSAMVGFVSSAVLVPVAVFVWGAPVSFLLLWAGWYIGGLLSYAIGRTLGRPVLHRLARASTLERYERWARSRRSLVPIVLFQLAIPSDLAGYVFGVIRCPLQSYAVALAVAEIPYAVGAVLLGVSFLEGRLLPLLALGLLGIAISAAVVRHYLQREPEALAP